MTFNGLRDSSASADDIRTRGSGSADDRSQQIFHRIHELSAMCSRYQETVKEDIECTLAVTRILTAVLDTLPRDGKECVTAAIYKNLHNSISRLYREHGASDDAEKEIPLSEATLAQKSGRARLFEEIPAVRARRDSHLDIVHSPEGWSDLGSPEVIEANLLVDETADTTRERQAPIEERQQRGDSAYGVQEFINQEKQQETTSQLPVSKPPIFAEYHAQIHPKLSRKLGSQPSTPEETAHFSSSTPRMPFWVTRKIQRKAAAIGLMDPDSSNPVSRPESSGADSAAPTSRPESNEGEGTAAMAPVGRVAFSENMASEASPAQMKGRDGKKRARDDVEDALDKENIERLKRSKKRSAPREPKEPTRRSKRINRA